MISDDFLTGLRLGGIAVFTWLFCRILFESWDITGRAQATRKLAWVFFRAGVVAMCLVMIFLASPANLRLANNLISLQTNFWMMCAVTVGAFIYAALTHHALDIATNKRPVTWVFCLLILMVSTSYGVMRVDAG